MVVEAFPQEPSYRTRPAVGLTEREVHAHHGRSPAMRKNVTSLKESVWIGRKQPDYKRQVLHSFPPLWDQSGVGDGGQHVKMKEVTGDPGGESKGHDEGWVQSKCICGNNKTLSVLTNLGFITPSSQLVSTRKQLH